MGRSLKKRKISKTKRAKISRPSSQKKSKKKKMKKWEWWLIGLAFVVAFAWLVFLGKSGFMSPELMPSKPTPAATATQ